MALKKLLNTGVAALLWRTTPKQSVSRLPSGVQNSLTNSSSKRFLACQSNDPPKQEDCKSFRHGFPEKLEAAINCQILAELNASMVYLSMFCYYGRTDIALPGCRSFFKVMYHEEQAHALDFMEYQLMRGAEVRLRPLTVPEDANWTDITVSLGVALELEKRVKEKLEKLAVLAECHKDWQLVDFVSSKYLKEQNDSICLMGRLLTKAKRLVDTGEVGRHLFDKELLEYIKKTDPEVEPPYKNI